jgi:inorganic pyrophosphatase
VDRLRHYFLTYKQSPDDAKASCEITHLYGREEALDVIRRSQADYDERFADLKSLLAGAPLG